MGLVHIQTSGLLSFCETKWIEVRDKFTRNWQDYKELRVILKGVIGVT